MNDQLLIEVYTAILQRHRVSVDELIATPHIRDEFLQQSQSLMGPIAERDLLLRLVSLRKRSRLPRLSDSV
jgi:hypothetical protein